MFKSLMYILYNNIPLFYENMFISFIIAFHSTLMTHKEIVFFGAILDVANKKTSIISMTPTYVVIYNWPIKVKRTLKIPLRII